MECKIGLELELNLIDEKGKLSNSADDILLNSKKNNYIIGELSKSMIEVIGAPSADVLEVGRNFGKNLLLLDDIVKEYNLMLVPSSTVGNDAKPMSNDSQRIRGNRKRKILGNYLRDLEHHICGTHVHIDHLSTIEKTYKQYLVMQAMDSMFSLMSSTPFFLGNNTKKDYRVDIYRNIIFKDFPLQGQLIDYPKSYEDIFKNREKGFKQWVSLDNYNGFDGFKPEDTSWGPIRLCKKTVESRCADANLFSKVLALATLYQAASHFIENENPKITINNDVGFSQKNFFNYKKKELILPNYDFLKKCEYDGINKGISSEILNPYLSNIMNTLKTYIKNKDLTYIDSFLESLKKKETFSDKIISYAKKNNLEKNHQLKESSAKEIRHYIASEYNKDLNIMKKNLRL